MTDSSSDSELFIKYLSKCPNERLEKLIHLLLDIFCGMKTEVYEEFSNIWPLMEWWNLVDKSQIFFQAYYNADNEVLRQLSLSEELKLILVDCFDVRKPDIKKSLVNKTHRISSCFLVDFDWKLKLTLASDKIAQINEPHLLIDLDLSGKTDESLHLDLSKEELKSLINTMEKAKKALADVSIPG